MPNVLQLLAGRDDNADVPSMPSAIITLPSSENISFTPAPKHPLMEYQPEDASGSAKAHQWNPAGADLLDIAVPFGVFLAPNTCEAAEASAIQKHASTNGAKVRCY